MSQYRLCKPAMAIGKRKVKQPEGGLVMSDPNSGPMVCLPRRLPREKLVDAARTAVEINPVNHPPLERLARIDPEFKPTRERLSVVTTKYWEAGGVRLTVGFLDDPPSDLRARIL
jgi:hypothetical protein